METYKTRNLAEASYILACGFSPDLEKEGDIFWFVFPAKCEQLSKTFWDKTGQISAKEYAEATRSLKERIFANK